MDELHDRMAMALRRIRTITRVTNDMPYAAMARIAAECIDALRDYDEQKAKGSCRKCGAPMKSGKAIAQTYQTSDEGTCSPAGPGVLIDCEKCPACGWSVARDEKKATEGKA